MSHETTTAASILVAVASHGRTQDHYLARVLAEYRKFRRHVRVVVLTNAPKIVPGAEVLVGLPTPNPHSLPFAHRKLFAENADNYDVFIYSEDDTLITEQVVEAFLAVQTKLHENEIAGLIRTETDPNGRRFITSIHHHFRWLPDSVVERGGELFARLSNEHSGCFIVTRGQLRKAIASGGFVVPPHAETYGMLETAASDLYTQCGLRRLISLSKIDEFIVPHLPNKYYLRMGIPIEDLRTQIAMLQKLHRNGGWRGELFEPGSAARCFRWSKDLYERPDEQLLKAIPPMAENVLSVGCGWGENEKFLSRKNLSVCAVPVDAVFGALLSKRGIRNVVGPLPEVLEELGGEQFDAVLLADVLHLVSDPVDWLRRLSVCLKPDGVVVASVPNTGELSRPIQKWLDSASNRLSVRGSNTAVHRISVSIVRSWLGTAGLTAVSVRPSMDGAERRLRRWASKVLGAPAAKRFIITAKPTK